MLGGKLPNPEEPVKKKQNLKNVNVSAKGVFTSEGGLFRGGLKARRMAKKYSKENPGKTGTALYQKDKNINFKHLKGTEEKYVSKSFEGGKGNPVKKKYKFIKKKT